MDKKPRFGGVFYCFDNSHFLPEIEPPKAENHDHRETF